MPGYVLPRSRYPQSNPVRFPPVDQTAARPQRPGLPTRGIQAVMRNPAHTVEAMNTSVVNPLGKEEVASLGVRSN